ncbi:VanZ family protein [Paenisporosarcina sp. NPDC076898]|uniref:VanZ family protein n=1 Tax=unclassified Paenisporosarcina TaxID=2642018 RepID=UPI003D061B0F
MKKYLWFLLILAVLFISSSQTYEESSLIPTLKQWLPEEPLKGVLSIIQIPYWDTTVSINERGYYHFVEFLIRKGAHILTFGALAIVSYFILKRYIRAFLITLMMAIMDELHQSSTAGRTATIQDVFLDAFGALLALTILFVLHKVRKDRRGSPKVN